jgi:FkbM family methyltransferase
MMELLYRAARKLKRSNFPGHGLLNLMYYDPETVVLHQANLDYVVVDGCKFFVSDQIDSIQRVRGNPWFANVRETDTVVDIGANIGAIAIPLAQTAKRVLAIEPLFCEELWDNAQLNGLKHVIVLRSGIGPSAVSQRFEFGPRSGEAPCMPFSKAKAMLNMPIDFLKMDCEGCEWSIQPVEMAGIRELRIEFHMRRGHKKEDTAAFAKWKQWLDDNNYTYTIGRMKVPPCVPFYDYFLLNASRREE